MPIGYVADRLVMVGECSTNDLFTASESAVIFVMLLTLNPPALNEPVIILAPDFKKYDAFHVRSIEPDRFVEIIDAEIGRAHV